MFGSDSPREGIGISQLDRSIECTLFLAGFTTITTILSTVPLAETYWLALGQTIALTSHSQCDWELPAET
jgi:hypothetical protein